MATVFELMIPGAFALGGVWLQKQLSQREKATDRQEARRALLREKAEEIYLEIELAQERTMASVMTAIKDLHGAIPSENLPVKANLNRIDRLKALLHMYFPNAAPILSEFEKASYGPIAKHAETFNELRHGPLSELLESQLLNRKVRSYAGDQTH